MHVSICIPAYEMHGQGVLMLNRCLDSIEKQTFRDFEIIVSDNSKNNKISELWQKRKDFRYIYNPKVGMATNTNNAVREAKGSLIKILYQDDYFADKDSLQDIVGNFAEGDIWMISGCSNNPHPTWNSEVPKGKNTLGSPSCLTMRYKTAMNEDLKWLLDCEMYGRMYKAFGWPKILDKVNVIIGIGEHQETNHLTEEEKLKELINAKE